VTGVQTCALPSYLQDLHGFDPAGASYVLFAMIAAYNLGTFTYGPLDRLLGGRRPVVRGGALATLSLILALAIWPEAPTAVAIALLLLFSAATPYYVTLTAQCREFVPGAAAGRAITTLNLAGLSGAFAMQWFSGLLIGITGNGDGLGTTLGYRLVFASLAVTLLAALIAYRKVPERPG
jgi:predicted MFS family arabinose efflux permease